MGNLSKFIMMRSSIRILKQTLAPVVLVIVFWISMVFGTTYFIRWVESANQRVYEENIISTRAAQGMKIAIWKLMADCPIDREQLSAFYSRWNEARIAMDTQQRTLEQRASAEEERVEMLNLNASLTEFHDAFRHLFELSAEGNSIGSRQSDLMAERATLLQVAQRVDQSVTALFDFNQSIVDEYRSERRLLNNRAITALWTMMALGPLLGIFLGWRAGLRLQRSITRIAVTLHDAGSNSDSNIKIVDIDSSGDFKEIEQQAEKIAHRMRSVSRELSAARSELLQSERLAAVGELAAGVAHEIRNPLTSVKLLLQHAIRQVSGPNLDDGKVRLILEEIGRMETTIQGLLDFSRPPKLNRVYHDFRQTLNRALNLLDARCRQQHIEIEPHISEMPLMVDGDTEKLHQLLVNLLINAVEAMPSGGCLTVVATTKRLSKYLSSDDNGRSRNGDSTGTVAQIVIRDTGVGIAPEVLSRLFEPFATTKERGTGLGLAVSHRIAEEHGGTIHACNHDGGGAQFTMTIPIVEAAVEALSV